MGMQLEETVREGRLTKEAGASSHVKKFSNNFSKKKELDVSVISYGRQRRKYQHVAAVSPIISPPMQQQHVQQQPPNQHPPQQALSQFNNQNHIKKRPRFDHIPMSYAELFPALLAKNHVQTRSPPPVPNDLPYWYKADQFCAYHQGAPGHNIENCFGLKSDVQRLVKSGILSFKDVNPNVQVNPLPQHSLASVNMDQMDQGYIVPYQARDYNQVNMVNSDNEVNVIVPQFNDSEPIQITYDSRKTSVTPLVINLPGPVPYQSDKVVSYKYNATMTDNGKDVPLPSIVNVADVSKVTRSGRIFAKRTEDVAAGKQAHVEIPFEPVGQSNNMNPKSDDDEVLKLIRKSEYNVVEQLLHTPSKIFVLSLLMNSEAHREALQKVLEQAYVDHDVTVGQFDGIVVNITAYNNLSFSNEDLPEEGRNPNMALNISINCMNDSLSSVLVDT
ncbi:uncharacterized protein LOC127136374 [Lathyrus oleraceus]|uniref:uncharacterized protein LOC127136374 n=1 Tax=Pisum sativum TaxID=3888 RepID=UPI0021CF1D6C|nr:uncharacterized protein LOC127136374 [Pisum sativum]